MTIEVQASNSTHERHASFARDSEQPVPTPTQTQELPLPPTIIPSVNKTERHLTLITPEFQALLDREWRDLDQWMTFKIHAALVPRIYTGEDMTIAELRDTVVVPEYYHQRQIYKDETADIHTRQIPDLKYRIMAAENDVRFLGVNGGGTSHHRRVQELEELRANQQKSELNGRLKETMVASITTFLDLPDKTEVTAHVERLTSTARKAALREVIDILDQQNTMLDDELWFKTPHEVTARTQKLQALKAELEALEALNTSSFETEHGNDFNTPPEVKTAKERLAMRKLFGSLASAAMAMQVTLFK